MGMRLAERFAAIMALALWVMTAFAPLAGAATVLSPETQLQPLGGQWSALRDPSGTLRIEDVAQSEAAHGFAPLPGNLAAGYDRGAWWLSAEIRRTADASADWLLEVEPAFLDEVTLFTGDGQGGFRAVTIGDRVPFSARQLAYRTLVFRLHLPDDLPLRVYLRIKSTSTISVSAQILSPEGFALRVSNSQIAHGLAHGASVILILLALVQYAAGRDRLYLGYITYAFPVEVMYLARDGLASQFLFPEMPLVADHLLGISLCLASGAAVLFAARVMELETYFPRMNRVYRILGRGCQWSALSVPAGFYGLAAPVIVSMLPVFFLVTTVLGLRRVVDGEAITRWYLAAVQIPFLINATIVARALGLADIPMELDLVAHYGACAHLLLIGSGLIWRGAAIEARRLQDRQAQLESAQLVEKALEERVRLRTQELAQSNAALAMEIAERRAAEDRVREREGQLRAILDAAPFPMVVSSFPDGIVTFLNGPASELLNVAPAFCIGQDVTKFYVDAADRDILVLQLAASGAVLGSEIRVRRQPDEERWVLLSAVRFFHGGQDCALVCLNDITTRKELEGMLRLGRRRAEAALEAERQATREQRNFLAMVSHEFRVPLAIIEAASQLLRIYLNANDEAGDEIAKIRRAVRRMSELIDVCLADDRLDASAMQLQLGSVDVTRMLMDICDDKRPFAGNRELVVRAQERGLVKADPTLLRIAFSNLIENALKFSPPHDPVSVDVIIHPDAVQVRVKDLGPGIAPEEQPRIFEKFYRSTKSDRVRGAGLGLYIVKRIMDLHGAAISVDSQAGAGTAFDIWLPSAAVDKTN
ncbi:Signal transduction histidine kinase [Paramagnetospirillum magnetotacticum MS-1]|uniref:histidine kinase n=1 Tax=Paramagnetospirillum magnetotacticum MS-1 TaxID=272627 RepID=A0A0C2YBG8_PARME|nr:7TM-DISM domain-containing protein [Paramagnetospirillum magnetotacticum]KIL97074.1 Signal transduction histidine kinase [Paramagnetospirillum magnetotacticum MS-1]